MHYGLKFVHFLHFNHYKVTFLILPVGCVHLVWGGWVNSKVPLAGGDDNGPLWSIGSPSDKDANWWGVDLLLCDGALVHVQLGGKWTTGPSMFNVFLLEKPHDLSPVGPLLKCVLCEDLPSTLSQIGSVLMHIIQARKEQWLSHSIMYLFCVAVWVLCGVCVCARACVFLCLCTQNTGNTEPLAPWLVVEGLWHCFGLSHVPLTL